MSLRAIIFDFGNVIAFFDLRKAAARLGRPIGLSGPALLDRLGSAGFDELHATFERGDIDAREFSRRIDALVKLGTTHEEFVLAWGDIFSLNESIIPIVAGLKARGYRLILGSNTNEIHAARFRKQFASILALFDRLVLSYEIGSMKPHPDFYLACAAAAGLSPGECLLIDDLEQNIAGAAAAGMPGIAYTDTDALREELVNRSIRLEDEGPDREV